ncbi:MurR/RpiR family transcriptional regulator [Planosporangium thailandense]|uniref:MurR/RpiR family transcriptional regulator n=1 Tax=Planosporangium thailandense TaxID=765197 RepID=A0ABX0Y6M7_9ACTN|nr:SIS domain-containing protein [Planosporangium thailandense]NJC74061.1 MurR/RpiR family transcriptional regulator [Planosporangium thailandense]
MTTLAPTPILAALKLAASYHGEVGERLYRAIATDFPESLQRRPAQLVTSARASAEDLDRLLRDAGFSDTFELRYRAAKETNRRLSEPDLSVTTRSGPTGDRLALSRVLSREQDNLAGTLHALQSNGAFELAAQSILGSQRRWVFGDLKSTGYASLFAIDLTSALRDVVLIQPTAAAAITAVTDAHPSDTLTVFSFRSYSQLTLRLTREFHRLGCTVIALTDSYASPVSEFADHVLPINTGSESATHSPTAVVAVGHILASLSAAGAKGATRRARRRAEIARALESYTETAARS